MTDREVRFEDPDFDPDAYLASVSAPGSKPSPESAPFAFAASARDAFAAARDRLGSHAAAAARRAADLAAVASDENDVFLSRVGDVATDAVALEATLDALHERVDRVAVVTRDVGESLRRAESRRVAADDAVRLARHLVAFDACRNRERLRFAVDPVFFDEARAAEAAPLARRLLELATDTRETACVRSSSRNAVGVISVRADGALNENVDAKSVANVFGSRAREGAFLATARENLEWYCDALEKRLLTTFEDAERAGDDAAATAAAAALETFGRGDSLARRFVATREMFMRCPTSTPEVDEDDESARAERKKGLENINAASWTSSAEETSFSRAKSSTLLEDFESIKNDTVAETRRAFRLFPEGPASEKAVAALTHRVVEQSVGAALDAALGAAPPPSPLVFVRLAEVDETDVPEKRFDEGLARRPPAVGDERLFRRARSQEAMLRNAGARSAPVSPLKPKTSAAARHRRAASVSVAATSRLGANSAAAARDASSTVSLKPLTPPAEFGPFVGRDEDAERPRGGDEGFDETKSRDGDGATDFFATRDERVAFFSDDDADSDDDFLDFLARRENDVRDAARAFALAAYLGALAEAHALARRLASELHAETGGVVRVADALDALFAARRAGYDEMEIACLRGLVAARGGLGGADHFDDGGEEATLSLSTDRRQGSTRECEKDSDAAEALLAKRERGVLLEIPRWYGAAAKRVDAVFAPPLAEKAGGEDLLREGPEDTADVSSYEENGKDLRSSTRSARAIAAATSLASAAAAEQRIAEASFEEMTRVAAATAKRAAKLCATRARQLPPATKEEAGDEANREIAAAAADACLGPACSAVTAVAEAVSAARAVSQARAAAAAGRVASASEAMGGGGDVAASAAAAARATADAASRATAEAAAKFESRAGAAASRCFRAALDAFFGVVDAELKAKLCGKKSREAYAFDFGSSADADASFFPGQHASRACASALAHLRRAAETLDAFASSLQTIRFGVSSTSRALLQHELSSRTLSLVTRHFFELNRFAYTTAGALQLKRDLGEFEAATTVALLSSSAGEGEANAEVAAALREKTKKQWRDTLEACDVLLVPPDALPGLLKQRTAESAGGKEKETAGGGADAFHVVSLRADFHPSMAEGLKLGLAEKEIAGARAPHARSASLSSAFFASFRTHSPPPTR